MLYLKEFSSKYANCTSKHKNKLFLTFVFAFLNIIVELLLITIIPISNLNEKSFKSNFDYLTFNICKSEVMKLDDSILSLEKLVKLNERELNTLNRYVSSFNYSYSFDPILNNSQLLINNEEVNVQIIPTFSSVYLNKTYDFDNYKYNDIVVNDDFINKYGEDCSIELTCNKSFMYNDIYDEIDFTKTLKIKNTITNINFYNEPQIYLNAQSFIYFLDTLTLENISNKLNEDFTVHKLLQNDKDGTITNSYYYLIGLYSYDDYLILKDICESSVFELTSNSILQSETFSQVYNLISTIGYIILFISIIALIIICLLQTYINFLGTTQSLGLVSSFGVDNFDCHYLFSYSMFSNLKLSFVVCLPFSIVIFFVINFSSLSVYFNNFILNSIFIILFSYLLLYLLIYVSSFLTFTFLRKKNISRLIKEE